MINETFDIHEKKAKTTSRLNAGIDRSLLPFHSASGQLQKYIEAKLLLTTSDSSNFKILILSIFRNSRDNYWLVVCSKLPW